jgi:hypothetical protein
MQYHQEIIVSTKKGHRTVFYTPYGRIPLRDAKESVILQLSEEAIRDGKKYNPEGCAIALQTKFDAELGAETAIPGFLGIQVRKTATLVARATKSGIIATRYVHSAELNRRINGFDGTSSTKEKLAAGDLVELLAPKGHRRIGKNNGTPGPAGHVTKNPRKAKACVRRGVYIDPVHAAAAKSADPEMSVRK